MNRFAFILSFLVFCAACAPVTQEHIPDFSAGDSIRCVSGGGEGVSDEFLFTGDGKIRYTPVSGPVVERTLDAAQTRELYDRLVSAGLLRLTEVPNRDLERYGVVIEAKLGERSLRGTIGVLEMTRKKHQKWRDLLAIITEEIGVCREENHET